MSEDKDSATIKLSRKTIPRVVAGTLAVGIGGIVSSIFVLFYLIMVVMDAGASISRIEGLMHDDTHEDVQGKQEEVLVRLQEIEGKFERVSGRRLDAHSINIKRIDTQVIDLNVRVQSLEKVVLPLKEEGKE